MGLFSAVRGRGLLGGFWRRPSTSFLLAATILYLLQLFPLWPGIFLMMFGGVFITGWLILLAVLALFLEALFGYLPRVLIGLPLALAGAYYGTLASEFARLPGIATELELREPTRVMTFDPANHIIQDLSLDLLAAYRIPSIYNPKIGKVPGLGQTRSIGETRTCEMFRYGAGKKNNLAAPLGIGIDSVGEVFCISYREVPAPTSGVITFGQKFSARIVDGLKVSILTQSVLLDGKEAGAYATATAEVLKPIPVLVLGCGLGYGGWECVASFGRDRVPLGPNAMTIRSSGPSSLEQSSYTGRVKARGAEDHATLIGLTPRSPEEIEAMIRIP